MMLKSLRKGSSLASSGGVVQVVPVAAGFHLGMKKPLGE
jgi:hypothetical protein